MKKTIRTISLSALLASAPLQAQTFDISQVEYWVGAGPDSSVLVVDFQDGTDDPSYAWGFLHDGTATGDFMGTGEWILLDKAANGALAGFANQAEDLLVCKS